MARFRVLSAALALALTVPAVALAQPRQPDPRHDPSGQNGRPGPQQGLPAQPTAVGQPVNAAPGRRSARDSDARFHELQQQPRGKMSEADRKEFSELEARQKRLDELKRRDAERERDRAERQRKAHQEQAARFRSPPSPQAQQEYSRYSQRKATLIRAREVADAEGRPDASRRAADLLALEEQRHAAWIAAHPG